MTIQETRRVQWSLRAILVVVTLHAIYFSWWRWDAESALLALVVYSPACTFGICRALKLTWSASVLLAVLTGMAVVVGGFLIALAID